MEIIKINRASLRKVTDKELLSLNHRLHQLYGSLDNIEDTEHRLVLKNEIKSKFKLVVEEMRKRKLKVSTNTKLYTEVFYKDDEIAIAPGVLKKFLNAIKKEEVVVPDYIDLIGSSVGALKSKNLKPNDIDILIRDKPRNESLEVLITHLLPKEYRNYFHFVYAEQGPHKSYRPLYNLVLKPVESKEKIIKDLTKLEPLIKFQPLKTSGGYGKEAFFSIDDAWQFWGAGYAKEGIDIETKFDGFRTIAEFDGKDTLIYFEDAKKDRSDILPDLVSDLKVIGKPVIFDGELILMKGKEKIPRKDMMVLLSKNPNLEGYSFVYEVFDILYYDNEDLHKLPWTERNKIKDKIFSKYDCKIMKKVEPHIVHSEEDFKKQSEKCGKVPDSEGAFYKVITSDYPLDGKSPLWAKFKWIKEIHVIVLDKKVVK